MTDAPGPLDPIVPKPWQTGLAPVYIGAFLWVAFFDQLGRRALPVGGLGWSLLGALAAGPLAYALLFRVPATWGQQAGRPLDGVAASTFGARGAGAVPGLLMAIGQVLFFAVAVAYAVDLTYGGLVLGRMIDPLPLRPVVLGGATLRAPLFLATALFWALATALIGFRFARWIAALMQFFPIFPALLLGLAMVGSMAGLRSFRPSGLDPISGVAFPPGAASWQAFLLTFQWVFAFTAMAGVAGADWGAGSTSPRDVRDGGWVGVAFAPVVVAALALLAVAGHQGGGGPSADARDAPARSRPGEARMPPSGSSIEELPGPGGGRAVAPGPSSPAEAPAFTFRAVLVGGFGRRVGPAMLMVFGLASLAPACFSAFDFGRRLATIGPGISRLTWTLIGATTAWLLIVAGWADRTEAIFHVVGGLFAPVAGAMASDSWLARGRWPGPRRGVNPPGLVAWALGSAVGLAPTVALALGSDRFARLQPAALAAFAVAFATHAGLALVGLGSAPETPPGADPITEKLPT